MTDGVDFDTMRKVSCSILPVAVLHVRLGRGLTEGDTWRIKAMARGAKLKPDVIMAPVFPEVRQNAFETT